MSGIGALLMGGELVPVDGIDIIGPHDAKWAHLDCGDYRLRRGRPNKVLLHKTLADDPEKVLAGVGPAGGAERTAEYWQGDPKHSGAQGVTGDDGTFACLCDLVQIEAYHGNQANDESIGIETRELVGGGVYAAALHTTVAVTVAICAHLGIQLQCPRFYNRKPLERFADGGRTLIGVFGHRDVTDQRGQWDPGELLFDMLQALGCERFDFDKGEDRRVWALRQEQLRVKGHDIVADGIPGPQTTAALKLEGYKNGIWALGKAA